MSNPLFEASYRRLFGAGVTVGRDSERFFRRFYEIFLGDPDIAALFADTDMDRQIAMLRRSLFQVAAFYVVCEPTPELRRIAAVHAKLGVDVGYYDRWLEALVAAVDEFDPDADETTLYAWRWALAPGITYMKMAGRMSP